MLIVWVVLQATPPLVLTPVTMLHNHSATTWLSLSLWNAIKLAKWQCLAKSSLINKATFLYGHINEGFINKATSLIWPLIVGPKGGPINEVSLYNRIFLFKFLRLFDPTLITVLKFKGKVYCEELPICKNYKKNSEGKYLQYLCRYPLSKLNNMYADLSLLTKQCIENNVHSSQHTQLSSRVQTTYGILTDMINWHHMAYPFMDALMGKLHNTL